MVPSGDETLDLDPLIAYFISLFLLVYFRFLALFISIALYILYFLYHGSYRGLVMLHEEFCRVLELFCDCGLE